MLVFIDNGQCFIYYYKYFANFFIPKMTPACASSYDAELMNMLDRKCLLPD